MIDRIKELMEFKGLTSTQFADSVEVPRAVISHILSGRNNPSLEVVTKIVAAFPDVNVNWMLLGEGEMLKVLAPAIAPDSEPVKEPLVGTGKANDAPDTTVSRSKVQKDIEADSSSGIKVQDDKVIEQIVVFYTDKTFTAYKP